MFIEQADLTCLRQGDIVAEIPFPLPRIEDVRFLGTPKGASAERSTKMQFEPTLIPVGKSPTAWLTAQMYATITFCAVLSQCCDVSPTQNPPPRTLTLCRLVPVPDGIKKKPGLYEILQQNVDPYGDVRPFYALFYVGAHAKLESEYVADFGQPMSVRWTDYGTVLRRKILQMDDTNRAKFRMKVGAYFGRPTPEELNAGTADPWAGAEKATVAESLADRLKRAVRVISGKE